MRYAGAHVIVQRLHARADAYEICMMADRC
jgi:hypothetical protein